MRFALILLCACAGFGQTPAIDRVTNLSNDRDPICPGSLVYIYGNFGSGSNASASVVVNGKAAAVITAADFQFARATVNYIWKEFFSRGLVEPANQFDPARLDPDNPPPDPWTLQPPDSMRSD